jgi:GAF domain-containing protein
VPQLHALHRVTEALARASHLEAIYEEALDALLFTLQADRAAVLLFDDHGVMRFAAWRGLSDEYRAATDGHSPWPPDAREPEPLLVPDALADTSPVGLHDVLRSEGIRALAFIPLVSAGRLLGKCMVYFDQPHPYSQREVEVAQAIAAQVAFAIDRRRLETQLRLAAEALTATLDAVTDGITVQAPDGTLLFANRGAASMLGYASPGELVGASPGAIMERFKVFDEAGNPLPLNELPGRRALQGIDAPERLVRYQACDEPDERWSLVSARPVFTEDGVVRFVVNVFRDVTARQRTLRALHQSERRLAFLADTSRRLIGAAVDYSSVLERVAELFVPALADACTVREIAPDGTVRRVASRSSDAFDSAAVERYLRLPDPFADGQVLAKLLRGETIFLPDVDVGELMAPDADPEFVDVVERLRLQSLLIVPLTARGETVGVVSLVTAAGGRRYDTSDVGLVEEVARRAGLAVENARLFEERSTVATTLQRALLPPALPPIPGIELAARYKAAASEIGGDFYDVVPVGPSRWVIVVGDVSGKGIEAASLTAMVRYTLRAFAASATRPSELLAQLNDALLPQLPPERFCTVACVVLDTGHGTARLCISLGGHPRPLLATPDGIVGAVGRAGTLLGTLPEPQFEDDEIELRPGESLVVFTDGCLGELPTRIDEDRLAAVLQASARAGAGAAALAEAVEAAARAEVVHTDDLTVLVCRRI